MFFFCFVLVSSVLCNPCDSALNFMCLFAVFGLFKFQIYIFVFRHRYLNAMHLKFFSLYFNSLSAIFFLIFCLTNNCLVSSLIIEFLCVQYASKTYQMIKVTNDRSHWYSINYSDKKQFFFSLFLSNRLLRFLNREYKTEENIF